MLKFIYLPRRNPAYTPETFPARWRAHGALASSMSPWERMLVYVQADLARPAPAGASEAYDGFCYGYKNPGPAVPTEADRQYIETMTEDEHKAFAELIIPVCMWAEAKALKAGPHGGTTACLAYLDPAAAEAAARAYAGAEGASRVVANRRREDMNDAYVLPYQAFVEVAAADAGALAQVLDGVSGAPWREADLTVVARETVILDRLATAA